ncbi:hypothetical protein T492DRAFT_1063880 [Pavlovales sp. CCMP2436]|nr:hypothetical protein T492DRAFT_1063880 [Pavlovales sp. CCMP2436]
MDAGGRVSAGFMQTPRHAQTAKVRAAQPSAPVHFENAAGEGAGRGVRVQGAGGRGKGGGEVGGNSDALDIAELPSKSNASENEANSNLERNSERSPELSPELHSEFSSERMLAESIRVRYGQQAPPLPHDVLEQAPSSFGQAPPSFGQAPSQPASSFRLQVPSVRQQSVSVLHTPSDCKDLQRALAISAAARWAETVEALPVAHALVLALPVQRLVLPRAPVSRYAPTPLGLPPKPLPSGRGQPQPQPQCHLQDTAGGGSESRYGCHGSFAEYSVGYAIQYGGAGGYCGDTGHSGGNHHTFNHHNNFNSHNYINNINNNNINNKNNHNHNHNHNHHTGRSRNRADEAHACSGAVSLDFHSSPAQLGGSRAGGWARVSALGDGVDIINQYCHCH